MSWKRLAGLLVFVALSVTLLGQSLSTTTCPGTGCTTQSVRGYGSVGVQVTGSFSGTLNFEASVDGENFVALPLTSYSDGGAAVSSITAPGLWTGSIAGFGYMRVRVSSYMSGSAMVTTAVSSSPTTASGSSTPADNSVTSIKILDGEIVDADINATAAIAWSKVSKTGSSLQDLTTRSATDLTSGTLPDARFPATLPSASGANLTALNADNLGSGTVPTGRFPATLPALSGVNLTALNASALGSGTVPDARFPATLPAASGANLTALSATQLTTGTVPDARFPATLPAASGVNLTALNATNLGSGTVPDARFPATLPAASGVNLTALNASNLASGTVAFARGGNPFTVVTKSGNETVNNSAVLQTDDHLTFSIGSGERYLIDFYVSTDGSSAADIKFNLSVPANVTYNVGVDCLATTQASNTGSLVSLATSSSGADLVCGEGGSGLFLFIHIFGNVTSSTGTGSVSLTWAQNTQTVANTVVYAGSWFTRLRF